MAEVRSRRKKHTYSVSQVHSVDDVHLAQADTSEGFFARGREFESVYVNHRYTAQEREELSKFDSLDYLPSHSFAYKNWIKRQPSRLDWDRWVMMGLIGFSVGFLGFLLHQIIEIISEYKWDKAEDFIKYLRPSAGGSGMPELIGFLNGTVVRHIFNVKTFVVKFLSCACAVASGLPVGPEGPMIHMGGLIGAGLSQFRSGTLGFALPFFERFRNSEDRRNFIQAGAGAGVASAFGAPVGGLLFAMEEYSDSHVGGFRCLDCVCKQQQNVSSFWNMKLTWQTFFCCMIATFTTDLFNSAFTSFQYKGSFGLFRAEKYILFQVRFARVNLELHMARDVMAAPPCIISTRESVANLAHLLLDTPHGGFPVVHSSREGQEKTFYGMITRIELSVILFHPELFETIENPSPEDPEVTLLDYQQTTIHKLYNTDEIEDLLTKFCDDPVYDQQFVNLQPYVNQSALSEGLDGVPAGGESGSRAAGSNLSNQHSHGDGRTLDVTRSHLVIKPSLASLLLSFRKDLMGFHLEEALAAILQNQMEQNNIRVEMAEVTDMPNSTTA
uniref:Chloride channel protein n=1 Tax=Branchiostoma floridae TaxID=7739 RepID=C3YV02_BRAFL|eukprot:XP_002599853.1 hypothetical protein BRAFLDRAFT_95543 [Branchiostoma floridae]